MCCNHPDTTEMLIIGPGIVMCDDCSAIFDAYDPYNEESLEMPLTPGQLKTLIAKLLKKVSDAAQTLV